MRARNAVATVCVVLVAVAGVAGAAFVPLSGETAASTGTARSLSSDAALPVDASGQPARASNILPSDYVGPEACGSCHQERYDQWRKHPHSRMNQDASAATVKGDFASARIKLPKGEAVFETGADGFTMTLEQGGRRLRRYRVTRTVGSRFMQFYIGLQTEGPEPRSSPLYTMEQKLPFAYWFKIKRWLPNDYFDPLDPDVDAHGHATRDPFDAPETLDWTRTCMLCHNTYAYIYRLGLPRWAPGYAWSDLAFDPASLQAALGKTLDLADQTPETFTTMGKLTPNRNLIALGVSCESCHFGGRIHAAGGAQSWMPQYAGLAITPPNGMGKGARPDDPYVVNAICRQCHSAVGDTYANGAGMGNSREALDLMSGACFPSIKCTDCHDPHITIGAEAQPPLRKHLDACVRCHGKYADEAVAQKHGAHPAAAGVTCLDCHMPRIGQGLDEVVRSHRISSPSDPIMLSADQPNACNVCHIDRSIAWTAAQLGTKWRRSISLPQKRELEDAAGRAWLRSNNAPLRLVATQSWASSPHGRDALGGLLDELDDPVAVNRMFALFAIGRVTGEVPGVTRYDPTAPSATRKKQIGALKVALSAH
jgi:hypothetical protein